MASSATSCKFMCFLIIVGLAVPSMATDYYVCDPLGWTPAAISTIQQWLYAKKFIVGDVLHFVSSNPVHPVNLVTAEAYANCNATAALFTDVSGNCAYKLTEPGVYYFISALVECTLGLKIAITANLA